MSIPSPTSQNNSRRASALDIFVVSGESVNNDQIAERIGLTADQASRRRRMIVPRLKPGEKLTWEHLMPSNLKVIK